MGGLPVARDGRQDHGEGAGVTAGSHLNAVRYGATKARLIGAEVSSNREKDDFYPTPPEATEALLRAESFEGDIWEPACGDGAISKILAAAGHRVVSTDLVDRGYGLAGVDFLMEHRALAPNVITNPPFKLGSQFVRKALALSAGKVAMLLKIAFLEGRERADVLDDPRLARVWVFRRRISFTRGNDHTATIGGGMMCFAWFVWEHGYAGKPELGWV